MSSISHSDSVTLAAALGFLLEFEFSDLEGCRRRAIEEKPTNVLFQRNEITEEEGCDEPYVAQMDSFFPTSVPPGFPLCDYNEPAYLMNAPDEVVVEEFEEELILPSPRPVRQSSRVLFRSLGFDNVKEDIKKKKSQPRVHFAPSEEEVPAKKKRESSRVREIRTRKERQAVIKAAGSLRAFSHVSSLNNKAEKTNIAAWKDVTRLTTSWLSELERCVQIRKMEFYSFFVRCSAMMEATLSSAKPRPVETHKIMLRFAVDFVKIYEISQMLGIEETIGEISRLLEKVVGKYIGSSKRMNLTHIPWIQTREFLELMFSIVSKKSTVYGLIQTLNKIEIYFISKFASVRLKNLEFPGFALSQLEIFRSILVARLNHLSRKRKYGF